ncbi:MAG: imidazole glycerol phosphate synthase subunit HisH [Clostridia bacterium]|nr:imidazole glycerol phosphate synthase subunit HisH [Clostridia bacterium]
MIAIVDYGVGNLFSLRGALAAVGAETQVTGRLADLRGADAVVLPGVGAFGDAADKLRAAGLADELIALAGSGKPLLGICLGMQLLFDESEEYGRHAGLGLIPGRVVPLEGHVGDRKIPHMGWNRLEVRKPDPLFRKIGPGEHVYFVHSYWAECPEEYVLATAEYGVPVTAAVRRGNVCGMQFHPEKSGDAGLALLRAFCEGGIL